MCLISIWAKQSLSLKNPKSHGFIGQLRAWFVGGRASKRTMAIEHTIQEASSRRKTPTNGAPETQRRGVTESQCHEKLLPLWTQLHLLIQAVTTIYFHLQSPTPWLTQENRVEEYVLLKGGFPQSKPSKSSGRGTKVWRQTSFHFLSALGKSTSWSLLWPKTNNS